MLERRCVVFIPGQFDNEEDRTRRLESQTFGPSRKWLVVFVLGLIALVAFGALTMVGYPGTGVILVPIGLGMVIGGGIQVLVDRMA